MGKPYEISSRNGYGFLGYAYFFACTTTTSPKRISIKDSWDLHTFFVQLDFENPVIRDRGVVPGRQG